MRRVNNPTLVVFDIDASFDLFHMPKHGITRLGLCNKDIVEMAIRGWSEHHCSLQYSGRLTKDMVLMCIVDGSLPVAERASVEEQCEIQESVYRLVEHAYPIIDKVLSRALNPLSLFRVQQISWYGPNCFVRFDRGF